MRSKDCFPAAPGEGSKVSGPVPESTGEEGCVSLVA